MRFLGSGLAHGFLEAPQLVEMVADVDDVEAPPLIGTQGAEKEVTGDALQAETVAATVEQRVHLVQFQLEGLE